MYGSGDENQQFCDGECFINLVIGSEVMLTITYNHPLALYLQPLCVFIYLNGQLQSHHQF